MSLRVSVVVPTYRRPELLGRCLAALTAQTIKADSYEIVVADAAGSSEMRRQVEEIAAKTTCSIRYLPVTQAHGPAAARNAAWRVAGAPIIAFTDDDTVPDADWLAAGTSALERDCKLAAVTGCIFACLRADSSFARCPKPSSFTLSVQRRGASVCEEEENEAELKTPQGTNLSFLIFSFFFSVSLCLCG